MDILRQPDPVRMVFPPPTAPVDQTQRHASMTAATIKHEEVESSPESSATPSSTQTSTNTSPSSSPPQAKASSVRHAVSVVHQPTSSKATSSPVPVHPDAMDAPLFKRTTKPTVHLATNVSKDLMNHPSSNLSSTPKPATKPLPARNDKSSAVIINGLADSKHATKPQPQPQPQPQHKHKQSTPKITSNPPPHHHHQHPSLSTSSPLPNLAPQPEINALASELHTLHTHLATRHNKKMMPCVFDADGLCDRRRDCAFSHGLLGLLWALSQRLSREGRGILLRNAAVLGATADDADNEEGEAVLMEPGMLGYGERVRREYVKKPCLYLLTPSGCSVDCEAKGEYTHDVAALVRIARSRFERESEKVKGSWGAVAVALGVVVGEDVDVLPKEEEGIGEEKTGKKKSRGGGGEKVKEVEAPEAEAVEGLEGHAHVRSTCASCGHSGSASVAASAPETAKKQQKKNSRANKTPVHTEVEPGSSQHQPAVVPNVATTPVSRPQKTANHRRSGSETHHASSPSSENKTMPHSKPGPKNKTASNHEVALQTDHAGNGVCTHCSGSGLNGSPEPANPTTKPKNINNTPVEDATTPPTTTATSTSTPHPTASPKKSARAILIPATASSRPRVARTPTGSKPHTTSRRLTPRAQPTPTAAAPIIKHIARDAKPKPKPNPKQPSHNQKIYNKSKEKAHVAPIPRIDLQTFLEKTRLGRGGRVPDIAAALAEAEVEAAGMMHRDILTAEETGEEGRREMGVVNRMWRVASSGSGDSGSVEGGGEDDDEWEVSASPEEKGKGKGKKVGTSLIEL